MKTRIKNTAPTLKTRADLDEQLAELRELIIQRNALQAIVEARRKAIDDQLGPQLAGLTQRAEEITERCRAWAEANMEEFGKLKSLDTTHAIIGWRTSTPSLRTLAGWTWDRVLEKIRDLPNLWPYIRKKEEVNKEALIADREGLGPDMLRTIGCKVVQTESFYAEPKLEEIDNRQTSTAA